MGDQRVNLQAHDTRQALKRSAPDDDYAAQRLSKRFNLLNLDHDGKLYIAKPSEGDVEIQTKDDYMQLEDTKDKIYIHNLDEELAEVESLPDEERLIFLPDIERKLQAIHKQILVSSKDDEEKDQDNQLVLYSVPTSLSVPQEQDSVRKAILEARARARETAQASYDALLHDEEHQDDLQDEMPTSNEDAMEID